MGLRDAIVKWALKGVRVDKSVLVDSIDTADADQDGYIDLGELITAIRSVEW